MQRAPQVWGSMLLFSFVCFCFVPPHAGVLADGQILEIVDWRQGRSAAAAVAAEADVIFTDHRFRRASTAIHIFAVEVKRSFAGDFDLLLRRQGELDSVCDVAVTVSVPNVFDARDHGFHHDLAHEGEGEGNLCRYGRCSLWQRFAGGGDRSRRPVTARPNHHWYTVGREANAPTLRPVAGGRLAASVTLALGLGPRCRLSIPVVSYDSRCFPHRIHRPAKERSVVLDNLVLNQVQEE